MSANGHTLVRVARDDDWRSYHDIRRRVLFEAKGRVGVYQENHPDELKPGNQPLLLKFNDAAIGTTRFDRIGDDQGVVRLVAIILELQRKGHGRALSNLTEAFAIETGVSTLLVNSAPDAVGYYEKMGWSPFVWDPSELQGIASDAVQMRKEL